MPLNLNAQYSEADHQGLIKNTL